MSEQDDLDDNDKLFILLASMKEVKPPVKRMGFPFFVV